MHGLMERITCKSINFRNYLNAPVPQISNSLSSLSKAQESLYECQETKIENPNQFAVVEPGSPRGGANLLFDHFSPKTA